MIGYPTWTGAQIAIVRRNQASPGFPQNFPNLNPGAHCFSPRYPRRTITFILKKNIYIDIEGWDAGAGYSGVIQAHSGSCLVKNRVNPGENPGEIPLTVANTSKVPNHNPSNLSAIPGMCEPACLQPFSRPRPVPYRAGDWHAGLSTSTAPDDRARMEKNQSGRCAICNRKAKLVIDHCHATGFVRGLLCSRCNTGLGQFCDNTHLMEVAVEYLKVAQN